MKVSPLVPVLHMSFCDLPSNAADALSRIGIYILDSTVIGGSAYSQDIGRLVSEASPKGLLHSICIASKGENYKRVVLNFTDDLKRAMRDLLLDRVVAKVDTDQLTEIEREVMFSLPVWERHTGGALSNRKGSAFGPIRFTQEHSRERQIASQSALLPVPAPGHGPGPVSLSLSVSLVQTLQIPPRDVDSALFGEEFLVLRNDLDRSLYLKLGLLEPSKG